MVLSFNRRCPVSSQITAEIKKKKDWVFIISLVGKMKSKFACSAFTSISLLHISCLLSWRPCEVTRRIHPHQGEVYERQRAEKESFHTKIDQPWIAKRMSRAPSWLQTGAKATGGRGWQRCQDPSSQCHLVQSTCSLMDNLFSVVFSPTQNLTAESGYRCFLTMTAYSSSFCDHYFPCYCCL